MAEVKTVRHDGGVAEFLAGVADPQRRADAQALCALMSEVTGVAPTMWGPSIIGFGSYHYRYPSGREGDGPAVSLSPRKQALTLYLTGGFGGADELLARLGPHTVGKSCLHLLRLADVDRSVLQELIKLTYDQVNGTTIT